MKINRFFTMAAFPIVITTTSALGETHGQKFRTSDVASAHTHGMHIECPLPKIAMDVVRCAQEQHPDVQRAKLATNQVRALTDVAGQFKNPELQVESVSGDINGVKNSQSKLALLVPIEIGGKRSARYLEAESQGKKSEAQLLEVQSEITIKTVANLYRLRQLEIEKSLLQEAVNTFSQVISQQRSRPGLSPEQRVSLSVFKMALSEAKIRQSELFEEEKSLEHFFHVATGHSLAELKVVLPPALKMWPEIKSQLEESHSPGVLLSRADLDLALAQVQAARAETWPELRVGPMVQFQEQGPSRGSIFGFQLSLGLPVLSFNGGGRNFAALGETKAQRGVELRKSEENHERDEQLHIYQRTVQTLKDAPTQDELEKDHKQHESYAKRGLVSASLIIESHRQIEELTRSRHSREIKALESLWRIYKFDGRILTEKL